MKKYPKAFIADYSKTNNDIVKELLSYLHVEKKHISFDEIEKIFHSATPRAVVGEISKIIEKKVSYERI